MKAKIYSFSFSLGTYRFFLLYILPFLIFALVITVRVIPDEELILYGMAAAFLHYFYTRLMFREIERAEELKKAADEQLIQTQKLAAIGEMSSGIAHEINNPLAIITQEIEWIKHLLNDPFLNEFKNREELFDSFGAIAGQVERCKDITHKLLNFARKMEPLIQRTDINRLIEDMAYLVGKEAGMKNIEIVRNYLPELPQARTDQPLLRQVILNILNNAVQAIGKDGKITIHTRISESDDRIEIAIEDNGPGIAKENLDKIFNPFYTTKPPGQGTGLGLSISHAIVVRLGGTLSVQSEPGKGSVFIIRLPLGEDKK